MTRRLIICTWILCTVLIGARAMLSAQGTNPDSRTPNPGPKATIDQYNREGMPRFYVGKECRYIPSKVIGWLERRCQHRVIPPEETFDPRKELGR